jgi:hypothetical protein
MIARQIKDLSIALEALTRVPGYASDMMRDRINKLINDRLSELEEEKSALDKARREYNPPGLDTSDNIPF